MLREGEEAGFGDQKQNQNQITRFARNQNQITHFPRNQNQIGHFPKNDLKNGVNLKHLHVDHTRHLLSTLRPQAAIVASSGHCIGLQN